MLDIIMLVVVAIIPLILLYLIVVPYEPKQIPSKKENIMINKEKKDEKSLYDLLGPTGYNYHRQGQVEVKIQQILTKLEHFFEVVDIHNKKHTVSYIEDLTPVYYDADYISNYNNFILKTKNGTEIYEQHIVSKKPTKKLAHGHERYCVEISRQRGLVDGKPEVDSYTLYQDIPDSEYTESYND